jgi:Cu/Ag efflux pump CusA
LGLGLPSHHIVYALVSAIGTASVFTGLLILVMQFLPVTAFFGISDTFFNSFNWTSFAFTIGFFSSLGIIIAFWLSVTHFFVVPVLRMLGWR